MKRASIVPQSGQKLRDLRESAGFTQTQMADELEGLLKPHMKMGYTIQQADISRLELEETAIDTPKLLAYSHYFNQHIVHLLRPGFAAFCKSDIHLQSFANHQQADHYLHEMERGGRVLVHAHFPSDFFCNGQDSPRFQQIAQAGYHSTEMYDLSAFLSFLFSPISPYSLDIKAQILNRYLEYFRNNLRHHLRFFTRTTLTDLYLVPSMEMFPAQATLLVSSPVLQSQQGVSFFEVRNAEIFDEASSFYQQLPTLDGNLVFLRIGLETLGRMREGQEAKDSIRFFYNEVSKRTFDCAGAVLESFCPEVQEILHA